MRLVPLSPILLFNAACSAGARAVLFFSLAAGLAQGAAPAQAMTPREMTEYFCGDIKKPFYTSSGPVPGGVELVNSRPGSSRSSFTMPKPRGVMRVFIAGESAAGLLGSGRGAPLGGFLEKMFPGAAVEVINSGMGAYESRRIYGVLEEVLAYAPDLVVVLSGNNEADRDFCPDFGSELARRGRNLRANLARLSMSAADAAVSVSLALHEERLRAMARLARKKGVPIVFCTLPANLRDYAPGGAPPLDQPDFAEAMASLEKKDLPGALEHLKKNLTDHPHEPFSLFYAGRALDRLGRMTEARAYYAGAVNSDESQDRCSPERNAMIRRMAKEEGAGLADLEPAFSAIAEGGVTGGGELFDGVHWFERYTPFASAVIAGPAGESLRKSGRGAGTGPVPAVEAPRARPADEDFRRVFANLAGSLADGRFCDYPPDERAVITLKRLCRMDCGRLQGALLSGDKLDRELKDGFWNEGLKESASAWRAGLLYDAAEMLRRSGRAAEAGRCLDAAASLQAAVRKDAGPGAACPAINFLRGRLLYSGGDIQAGLGEFGKLPGSSRLEKMAEEVIPGRHPPAAPAAVAGPPGKRERPADPLAADSKKLSDAAVAEMARGGFAGARQLLLKAVAEDKDNFEARMNLCFLAAKTEDAGLGEEHCGEAVYLAVFPPRHALTPKDSASSALYSRGLFYLAVKNQAEGCRNILKAVELASAEWDFLAEAKGQLGKKCAPAAGPVPGGK